LGSANTEAQIDRVAELIDQIVHQSMHSVRFVACR
jgi:hypothetical protein